MRGAPISRSLRKLDLVIVDARYSRGGKRLQMARGFQRWGEVWSDRLLLERGSLVKMLREGGRVAIGRRTDLVGDFEILGALALEGADGNEAVVLEGHSGDGDELGVPLF